jgi:2-methylaconitate cis-trans-isomerase PrpF
MDDIAKLVLLHTGATGAMSAGAAEFTLQLGYGKDSRAVLFIDNTNAAAAVRATLKAGDGELAALGDMKLDIAAETAAAIPLSESMRYKIGATGKVIVNLTSTTDGALAAETLAGVKAVLIQG